MSDMTVFVDQPEAEVAGEATDQQLVEQLASRARSEGLSLTGEGGLLGRLTKMVVESGLEGEMDDHLGYAKHETAMQRSSSADRPQFGS